MWGRWCDHRSGEVRVRLLAWSRTVSERGPSMHERNFLVGLWRIALVILIGFTTVAIANGCKSKSGGDPVVAPPPAVTIARPKTQNVTDYVTFTGNTAPLD